MKKNMGSIDSLLQIIDGLVFIGPKTAWVWLGLIPLVTAFTDFCPVYLPFKIDTSKKKSV